MIITFGRQIVGTVSDESTLPKLTTSFQAESGTLGANWITTTTGGVTYIHINTTAGGTAPGSAARVATYSVVFPVDGVYDLYARIYVPSTPTSPNIHDAFYYGNGFGSKTVGDGTQWITVNNLSFVGYDAPGDVVLGAGSAIVDSWKWIKLSAFNGGEPPIQFTVPIGSLTQTFQIGGREDGFRIDKLLFATPQLYNVLQLDSY